MLITPEPGLINKLKKFGATDISACYHCGNCSAVCPLSKDYNTFPRRLIRLAQLGLNKSVAAAPEVWLCYYCGACSDTCPRDARPGSFMAAVRSYAISKVDFTGIAGLLHRGGLGATLFYLALSAFFAVFLMAHHSPMPQGPLQLFKFIPFELIHNMGLVVMGFLGLVMVVNALRTVVRNWQVQLPGQPATSKLKFSLKTLVPDLIAVVREIGVQRRFAECEEDKKPAPWFVSRRFLHLAMMWGFIVMGLATTWDFLFKTPGSAVSLLYPGRLLGTLGGLAAIYGSGMTILRRLAKAETTYTTSRYSDWMFLWIFFFAVLTGFTLEMADYLPLVGSWAYIAFLTHVVLAMDLLVLLPFTKFAHAVYRPIALAVHALKARAN